MEGLETNDWILFGGAAYLAVVSLVRLMIRHRARVSAKLVAEVERERHAKAVAKLAEEKRLREELKKEEEKKKEQKAA
jgi:hypothetical protein